MAMPEAVSMRSSRSTKRHASWRASRLPTVVFPEPMKPARHKTCVGFADPRVVKDEGCVIVARRCGAAGIGPLKSEQRRRTKLLWRDWKSVTLQDADCTTVGGQFDFS